jgi:ketosteroid isomerase-like protein
MTIFAPIIAFADVLNAADPVAITRLFVDSPTIIDDIPRHFWSGPAAIAEWTEDAHRVGGQLAPGQLDLRFERPLYADIHGEAEAIGSTGYAVLRSIYTVSKQGAIVASGYGLNTFALRREEDGWKILSWTFTHTGGHRRPLTPIDLDSWDQR